jgi:uncharacterized protein YbjT (DUF2867 family)
VRVYVLISSAGVDLSSTAPYGRMKAELERDVQALGFDHTVIVKPGVILGAREEPRMVEAAVQGLARLAGAISGGWLRDGWAQDAGVIARAAVAAGLKALDKESGTPKVWFVGQADVVRLGMAE